MDKSKLIQPSLLKFYSKSSDSNKRKDRPSGTVTQELNNNFKKMRLSSDIEDENQNEQNEIKHDSSKSNITQNLRELQSPPIKQEEYIMMQDVYESCEEYESSDSDDKQDCELKEEEEIEKCISPSSLNQQSHISPDLNTPKKVKKRGPYKTSSNKKKGKDRFLEEYIYNKTSPFFDWIEYENDRLFCKFCINAGSSYKNKWGDKTRGCKKFIKFACEKHEKSKVHQNAKYVIIQAKNSLSNIITKVAVPKINNYPHDNFLISSYKNLFYNI